MIYKKRSMPKKLIGLSALMPPLHPSHIDMQRIKEELRIRKAGYNGEGNFDKHLLEFKTPLSTRYLARHLPDTKRSLFPNGLHTYHASVHYNY